MAGLLHLVAIAALIGLSGCFGDFGAPDEGDFRASYERATDANLAEYRQAMIDDRMLETLAGDLNFWFKLPYDVDVVGRQCGEANAYWNGPSGPLVMCYELWEEVGTTLVDYYDWESDGALGTAIAGTIVFVFYHEAGHAVIDLFDLPITGREEDAADDLSALILLATYDDAYQVLVDAADWFQAMEDEAQAELNFADEHSLGEQRYINVMCIAYGLDSAAFADWVPDPISTSRAERCPGEYQQKEDSWNQLLADWLQPE